MARRKRIVKTTLPLDTGTLNATITSSNGLSINVDEEAPFRITKREVQNKLEANADWMDGINQFRVASLRNIELLMNKVLILEEKVEQLSNRKPL